MKKSTKRIPWEANSVTRYKRQSRVQNTQSPAIKTK